MGGGVSVFLGSMPISSVDMRRVWIRRGELGTGAEGERGRIFREEQMESVSSLTGLGDTRLPGQHLRCGLVFWRGLDFHTGTSH